MAEPVYSPIIRLALGIFRGLDLDIEVRGTEHIPATGGAVVAMNHISYLDFMLAGVPFWKPGRRLVRFMAKDSLFSHPVAGPLMRGMKHIPVDRTAGADAYRAAVDALRAGELVGVFPEATISRSFVLKDFKAGAVRMAHEAGVPVLPLALWGSQRTWTKGRKPKLGAARHHPVLLTVGAPIVTTGDTAADLATLRTALQALLDDERARYPEQPEPGAWWQPRALDGGAPSPEQAAQWDADEAAERVRKRAQSR